MRERGSEVFMPEIIVALNILDKRMPPHHLKLPQATAGIVEFVVFLGEAEA
jgi:hydrogenase/urease accessory protein HupE